MNNREVLNESFFGLGKKKKSYIEKLKSDLQYAPVDPRTKVATVDGVANPVTDIDIVKKRLTSAFGAAFGNNTVKSLTNKSIKKFPIVVSENIDPNTLIYIKKLLEDQVAEYINLLISNQVIDIGAYSVDDSESSGNIATRAVSDITGIEFSRQEIANKALKGSLSVDDVFAGSPAITLYNAIRENENSTFETASELMNTLFENAIIVPASEVKDVERALCTLTEAGYVGIEKSDESKVFKVAKQLYQACLDKEIIISDFARDFAEEGKLDKACLKVAATAFRIDKYKSFEEAKKHLVELCNEYDNLDIPDATQLKDLVDNPYEKFQKEIRNMESKKDKEEREKKEKEKNQSHNVFSDIMVSTFFNRGTQADQREKALDQNIAAMLLHPENKPLKDKYTKALTLLESRIIAGIEFIDYCRIRLGIPVNSEKASRIIQMYPLTGIYDFSKGFDDTGDYEKKGKDVLKGKGTEATKLMDAIAKRLDYTHYSRTIELTTRVSVKEVFNTMKTDKISKGLTIGGGAVGAIAIALATAPIVWPITLGIAGTGAIGAGIARAVSVIKKKKQPLTDNLKFRISGWERVEKLITAMDGNREEILQIANNGIREKSETAKLLKVVDDFADKVEKALKTTSKMSGTDLVEAYGEYPEYTDEEYNELMEAIEEDLKEDREAYADLMEATISLMRPVDVKQISYEPDSTLITPAGYARSRFAYGTVEYDRKENKDRRFNAPLIMTVKFRERYSDGKFDDNELVAVIGILGVITRVPSEEMKYILKANASGTTLDSILRPEKDTKDSVGDILADTKVKKLAQSADVWKSLERVSALAFANRLAGKNSNNISNAHIVFSQKEIDEVKTEEGIDYIRDRKLSAQLLKRYSAMSIMIANDAGERLYTFDDIDSKSWNVAPYSSLIGNNNSDQLITALTRLERNRLG